MRSRHKVKLGDITSAAVFPITVLRYTWSPHHMNRFATTLLGATLLAMPAFAANLPGTAQSSAVMPFFPAPHNWSGFFIGVNAGFVRGATRFSDEGA